MAGRPAAAWLGATGLLGWLSGVRARAWFACGELGDERGAGDVVLEFHEESFHGSLGLSAAAVTCSAMSGNRK